MRIILKGLDGLTIEYEQALGGFNPVSTPCFKCGTCCSKWQAPVDSQEARRIAEYLGIPEKEFYEHYVRTYPMKADCYLINHERSGCIFLHGGEGKATCLIHATRPEACRSWTPGLARVECRQGLKRLGRGGILKVGDLNLTQEELFSFCQSLQDDAGYSIMRPLEGDVATHE
ncbi:MAG: YkgJ family cysteine cluster protein [Chloroflexi bacterium]|nr:YkgJ family cysteine cluster protein [Chloroflexota bacterium]